ncbi:MAG: SLC13 family permease [Chlamydiota bacterium]|nr:SLC13 family permease [Chlamydiota bacterium]
MTFDQLIIFCVLISTLFLFVFSKWRYDLVACLALIMVALSGTVPMNRIFAGFGHPAVITVAAVLIISRGLQNSGLIEIIAKWIMKVGKNRTIELTLLLVIVVTISGFMNNVGALAIMMPVAIQIARKNKRSPSYLLMPLAFGSLLGGLITMIGTPPNIIIGTMRMANGDQAFSMFDFAPVGVGVALAGIIYMIVIGWRFIPDRKGQASTDELFHIKEYTTEVTIPEDSELVGKQLSHLETLVESAITIIGLVRGKRRLLAPSGFETIWANDILIVEANPESLKNFLDVTNFEMVGNDDEVEGVLESDKVVLIETIISTNSPIVGKNARGLHLRWRYGVNLLAVARHGERLEDRLARIRFEVGDILLLQVPKESIQETLSLLGCLPLAKRELRIGQPRRIIASLAIFGIAILCAVTGFFPVEIAFTCAALAMAILNLIPLKEIYQSVDWPVIVLLGAMIPLGEAMENTGGAALVGNTIVDITQSMDASMTLGILLVITIILSNVMNNAAVAVLMAPIAISIAQRLLASPDPFLMTVAIGASSPFLTPIGHQSNALVMGPGGYNFGDYWKMGIFLTLIVILVTIPLILNVWPLYPDTIKFR